MVIECSVSVPPAPPSSAAAVETVKINSPCGRNAAEERRQRQRARRNEHEHEETNDMAVGSRDGASLAACGAKGGEHMDGMDNEPKNAEEAAAMHKELTAQESAILAENTAL